MRVKMRHVTCLKQVLETVSCTWVKKTQIGDFISLLLINAGKTILVILFGS